MNHLGFLISGCLALFNCHFLSIEYENLLIDRSQKEDERNIASKWHTGYQLRFPGQ